MIKGVFVKALLTAVAVMAVLGVGAAVIISSGNKTNNKETESVKTVSAVKKENIKKENTSSVTSSASAVSSAPAESTASASASKPTASKATVSKSTAVTSNANNGGAAAQPTYIQGVLIVNKTYGLPRNYGNGLTPETKTALNNMIAGAKAEGISLWSVSGYRSYDRQNTLYTNYCKQSGKEAADRFSARPGYSEHQTGLAIDLNNASSSFAGTKEAIWLEKNCYKYGFIIRYGKDKEQYTGFKYEPWHVRYLGVELATKVTQSGKCLEEYFGITSKYAN